MPWCHGSLKVAPSGSTAQGLPFGPEETHGSPSHLGTQNPEKSQVGTFQGWAPVGTRPVSVRRER